MTTKRVRYQASDAKNPEQRFHETGDIMMLVLAIGRQPHAPPRWAVEVCSGLYEHVASLHAVGAQRSKMGRRLDEVWRYFLARADQWEADNPGRTLPRKGPSVREAMAHAIKIVDGEDPKKHAGFDATLRSAYRAWKLEQRSANIESLADHELFDGLISTARYLRILEEWGAERFDGVTAREAVKALFRSSQD